MPFLSQEDRDAAANPRKCPACHAEIRNEYCSRCDEFFHVGHNEGCPAAVDHNPEYAGDRGYRRTLFVAPVEAPSITCPTCGWTSYNSNDIREQYCGHCHAWHSDLKKEV